MNSILDIRCEICGRNDRRLIKHHVSYNPEITMCTCSEECHAKAPQIQIRPAKSMHLDPDVHLLIVNARNRLLNKNIDIKITEIVGSIIKDHIDEFVDKIEDTKNQYTRTIHEKQLIDA